MILSLQSCTGWHWLILASPVDHTNLILQAGHQWPSWNCVAFINCRFNGGSFDKENKNHYSFDPFEFDTMISINLFIARKKANKMKWMNVDRRANVICETKIKIKLYGQTKKNIVKSNGQTKYYPKILFVQSENILALSKLILLF